MRTLLENDPIYDPIYDAGKSRESDGNREERTERSYSGRSSEWRGNKIQKGDWVKIKLTSGMWSKFCGLFKVTDVQRFYVILENGEKWNLRRVAWYGSASMVDPELVDHDGEVYGGCSSYMMRDDESFMQEEECNVPLKECIGVRAPSSGDILKLGEANACWSIQELECMDTDTFTKNVELFGSIKRFNTSQIIIMKEKAKEVWGALANWKSYHIVSLGRIALALNSSEIEELDLSSLDTVVALSQQTEWTTDQAKAIFKGVLNDSRKSVSDLKSIDLVGLGTNLCAVDFKEIPSIKTSEFSTVIARIGSLPCGMSVLREFKKKAERVFGTSEKWNSSVLYDIGIIAETNLGSEKVIGKDHLGLNNAIGIKEQIDCENLRMGYNDEDV
ncbi:hypothetical protein NDU88_002327 [Pleurodeles waltl]|uniref:Uncharacterized protein n=1 Tax=Pleurodeles waltl TaxID=8319 RepID=A0AAV7M3T2_PLEWA|nr:hypothetical protein NDU88_002327 [Pleurodeles waltl]